MCIRTFISFNSQTCTAFHSPSHTPCMKHHLPLILSAPTLIPLSLTLSNVIWGLKTMDDWSEILQINMFGYAHSKLSAYPYVIALLLFISINLKFSLPIQLLTSILQVQVQTRIDLSCPAHLSTYYKVETPTLNQNLQTVTIHLCSRVHAPPAGDPMHRYFPKASHPAYETKNTTGIHPGYDEFFDCPTDTKYGWVAAW